MDKMEKEKGSKNFFTVNWISVFKIFVTESVELYNLKFQFRLQQVPLILLP
jgi:hypothetical protein